MVRAEIRSHLASLKAGERMAFIDAHATEVAAAVLAAPGFLSGLSPAELGVVKQRIEARANPAITKAKVETVRAVNDAETGWRAAFKQIAERGDLPPWVAKLDEAASETQSVQSRLVETQSRLEAAQSELESAKQGAEQAKAQVAELEQKAASLKSELQKADGQRIEHVRLVPKADIDSHCSLRRTDRSRTAWRKVGKIRMRSPAKPRDWAQLRHSVALPAAFSRMPRASSVPTNSVTVSSPVASMLVTGSRSTTT